jgi:hypothetical protein
MRCYFHLVNGHESIPDDTGIEVSGLTTAQDMALQAIEDQGGGDPAGRILAGLATRYRRSLRPYPLVDPLGSYVPLTTDKGSDALGACGSIAPEAWPTAGSR